MKATKHLLTKLIYNCFCQGLVCLSELKRAGQEKRQHNTGSTTSPHLTLTLFILRLREIRKVGLLPETIMLAAEWNILHYTTT